MTKNVPAIGRRLLGRLLHRAILHGLRAPRVAHQPALSTLALPGGRLQAMRLAGPRGRSLAAWFVQPAGEASGPRPTVLAMHGWGANASTMWTVVPPLLDAGMAVLLLDARCHGDSDDEAFTSMPRFAEDIAAGLQWLRTQPQVDAQRLALIGHSVGAAAAILHAAGETAGDGPRAVVSLSAFAHPQELMRRWLAEHRIPFTLVGAAVLEHVQSVIGARFDDIAPLNTIRALRCPVLLVHGRDDTTVPFDDALRLQQAARRAELLAVQGGHDLREGLGPHEARIVAFLAGALS